MKIKSEDIWLDYEERGDPMGLPVIFIHGFPFNKSMWDPQFESLPSGIRAIRYDVRGHGESDVGNGIYSLEFFVDDLFKLMDSLNIEKAVLCGLSMGGYIALRAAEKDKSRITALVLADTRSEADSNEAKIKRTAGIRQLREKGMEGYSGDFLKNVFTSKSINSNTDAVRATKAAMLSNNPLGMQGALLALASRTDTTDSLSLFNFPVLILVGEEDKITPSSAAEAMKSQIPGSILHLIPSASHLSNLENPEVFNTYLWTFLEKIRNSLPNRLIPPL